MSLIAADFTAPAGVLFVEDFDELAPRADEHPEIIAPVYRAEDVEDAREEGRIAGAEEARADHDAIQTALCNAALAAIGDGLASARADAAMVAEARAAEIGGAMLALLGAALPAATARLAPQEVAALLTALLPPLAHTPNVTLRVHPCVFAGLSAHLAGFAGVTAHEDDTLAPGDVVLKWQDGEARRDWASLWAQLSVALTPFEIPAALPATHGG